MSFFAESFFAESECVHTECIDFVPICKVGAKLILNLLLVIQYANVCANLLPIYVQKIQVIEFYP
jgi:hypothetical protein